MFTSRLLPPLLFGLTIALVAAPVPAADPVDQAKIKKLVTQLGSDVFAEREQATRELERIGFPALDELRKATKDDDIEVKRRATDLVSRLEKRLESTTVLAPTKVNLEFADVPVTKAVADLAKVSGYKIVLQDPKNELKDKTVTLKTGEVSFWEAFDQLCNEAGLVESNVATGTTLQPRPIIRGGGFTPAPVRPLVPAKPVEPPAVDPKPMENKTKPAKEGRDDVPPRADEPAAPAPARPAAPVAMLDDIMIIGEIDGMMNPMPALQPSQITLIPGKPSKLAADYSTAIRIRRPGQGAKRTQTRRSPPRHASGVAGTEADLAKTRHGEA